MKEQTVIKTIFLGIIVSFLIIIIGETIRNSTFVYFGSITLVSSFVLSVADFRQEIPFVDYGSDN